MILIWVLLLVNILFQNTHHKIIIKKKRFSLELDSETNFIMLRNGHPSDCIPSSTAWFLKLYGNHCTLMIHKHLYNHGCIVMIYLFLSQYSPEERNICSSTEHSVSYCLIFNLNVITTILVRKSYTVLSQYRLLCISSLTRDLHSLFRIIVCRTGYVLWCI